MLKEDRIIKELDREIKKTKATKKKTGKIYLALVTAYPLVRIENKKQHKVAENIVALLIHYITENEIGNTQLTELYQYLSCLRTLTLYFETKIRSHLS